MLISRPGVSAIHELRGKHFMLATARKQIQQTGFRLLKSAIIAPDLQARLELVRRTYGESSSEFLQLRELIQKAAITASTTTDLDIGKVNHAYFGAVTQPSLPRRLLQLGAREVRSGVRMINPSARLQGYWVAQGKSKPVSPFAVQGDTLHALKVAVLWVQSDEAFKFADDVVDAASQADADRAINDTIDASFIDPLNVGAANAEPASITHGAPTIISTGDPSSDIPALWEIYLGDPAAAVYIMHSLTAVRLSMARDADGGFLFPNLGPKGGELLGVPVLTTRGSPVDSSGGSIALVDASAISIVMEAMTMRRSQSATIEMESQPSDPPTASSVLVSTFQMNLTAVVAEIFCNWKVNREGAVVVLQNALYPAS